MVLTREQRKSIFIAPESPKLAQFGFVPTTLIDSVAERSKKLRPILKAARRISRSARKKSARLRKNEATDESKSRRRGDVSKKLRFLPSVQFFEISPRVDKIFGVVNMPDSPLRNIKKTKITDFLTPGKKSEVDDVIVLSNPENSVVGGSQNSAEDFLSQISDSNAGDNSAPHYRRVSFAAEKTESKGKIKKRRRNEEKFKAIFENWRGNEKIVVDEYDVTLPIEKSSAADDYDVIFSEKKSIDQFQEPTNSRTTCRRRSFLLANEKIANGRRCANSKIPRRSNLGGSTREVDVSELAAVQRNDSDDILVQGRECLAECQLFGAVKDEEITLEDDSNGEKVFFPIFASKSKKIEKRLKKREKEKKIMLNPSVTIRTRKPGNLEENLSDYVTSIFSEKENETEFETWATTERTVYKERDHAPFSTYSKTWCTDAQGQNQAEDFNQFLKYHSLSVGSEPFDFSNLNYSTDFSSFYASLPKQTALFAQTAAKIDLSLPSQTDEQENFLPWVDQCKPKKGSDFMANDSTKDGLSNWLKEWKNRLQKSEKRTKNSMSGENICYDSDSDYVDDEDEADSASCPSLAFLHGPTGSGKTTLVYCLAKELGFSVIEINCSSVRSNKDVTNHIGATHSHRIGLHRISEKRKDPSMSDGGAFSSNLRAFFKNASPKTTVNPSKKIVEISDDDFTMDCTPINENYAMSVILFDDVDVIFRQDDNFWNGVRDLVEESCIPIVLTSSDAEPDDLLALNVEIKRFDLLKLGRKQLFDHFKCTLQHSDAFSTVTRETFDSLCSYCNDDFRKILNLVQFWGNFPLFSVRGESYKFSGGIVNRTKNEARVLDGLGEKPRWACCDFDFLNLMHFAHEKYDVIASVNNTKASMLQMEGDNFSSVKKLAPWSDNTTAGVNNVMTSDSQLDDDNVFGVNYFTHVTDDVIGGVNQVGALVSHMERKSLHENFLSLDVLPYLRCIVKFSSLRQEQCRTGRVRPYLHKIGLDDKWKSLHNILSAEIFR